MLLFLWLTLVYSGMAGAGCHHFRCFWRRWAGAQCAVCHSAGADGFFAGGAAPGQVESALGFDVSNYHLLLYASQLVLLQNFLPILFCDFYGKRGPGGSVFGRLPCLPLGKTCFSFCSWQCRWCLRQCMAGAFGASQARSAGRSLSSWGGLAVLFYFAVTWLLPFGAPMGSLPRDVSQCEQSQRVCSPAGAWDGVCPDVKWTVTGGGGSGSLVLPESTEPAPHRGETRPNGGPGISGDGGTASGHQSQCAGNRL